MKVYVVHTHERCEGSTIEGVFEHEKDAMQLHHRLKADRAGSGGVDQVTTECLVLQPEALIREHAPSVFTTPCRRPDCGRVAAFNLHLCGQHYTEALSHKHLFELAQLTKTGHLILFCIGCGTSIETLPFFKGEVAP